MAAIAVKLGIHKNTVYHYFNGRTKRFDRDITEIALQIISERKAYEKKFEEVLQIN